MGFRAAVDMILNWKADDGGGRNCLAALHQECARSYWHGVRAKTELAVTVADAASDEPLHIAVDRVAERNIRSRLGTVIEATAFWQDFASENPLGELAGFRGTSDYINAMKLHIPEIYAETLRVDKYIAAIEEVPPDVSLAELQSSLEHLLRNHMIFLLPALEFAAAESSWA